jgi:cytoskeleton protein RodZ
MSDFSEVRADDSNHNEAAEINLASAGMLGKSSTPGEILHAAREAYGWTIDQVANHLYMQPRQLVALEEGDHGVLPGMVFVRGFMRNYARLLKIDPAPLLAQIENIPSHATSSSRFTYRAQPISSVGAQPPALAPDRTLPMLTGVAVLFAIGITAYWMGWLPVHMGWNGDQSQLSEQTVDVKAKLAAMDVSIRSSEASGDKKVIPTDATEDKTSNSPDIAAAESGMTTSSDSLPLPAIANSKITILSTSKTLSSLPLPGVKSDAINHAETSAEKSAGRNVNPGAEQPILQSVNLAKLHLDQSFSYSNMPSTARENSTLAAPNPLKLSLQEDSWVQIKRADKSLIVSKVLKAGSVETFNVSEPVTLTIGNIAGVEASLRGTPIELASIATGNVARIQLK